MKENYVVSNEYLAERGLDLNDYAVSGTYINAIIQRALGFCVSRICKLGDNLKGASDIEKLLDEHQDKVEAFLELQYNVIYNLIFQGDNLPIGEHEDSIIVFQLELGKINGFQKGLHYKLER